MRIAGAAAAVLLGLSGCASTGIVIHRMPPETPAADNAAAIERAKALPASGPQSAAQGASAQPSAPPLTPADAPSMKTYDPWSVSTLRLPVQREVRRSRVPASLERLSPAACAAADRRA